MKIVMFSFHHLATLFSRNIPLIGIWMGLAKTAEVVNPPEYEEWQAFFLYCLYQKNLFFRSSHKVLLKVHLD